VIRLFEFSSPKRLALKEERQQLIDLYKYCIKLKKKVKKLKKKLKKK
jgi:hypothetical protein